MIQKRVGGELTVLIYLVLDKIVILVMELQYWNLTKACPNVKVKYPHYNTLFYKIDHMINTL